MSVAHGDLLHEYLVFVVQLTLPWENDLLVELLFQAFDLGLDTAVNFGAQFLVEGVCDEVGVGLALFDKVVSQLVNLRDNGLGDNFKDLGVGI